jgi:hypothetical protein
MIPGHSQDVHGRHAQVTKVLDQEIEKYPVTAWSTAILRITGKNHAVEVPPALSQALGEPAQCQVKRALTRILFGPGNSDLGVVPQKRRAV